MKKKLLVKKKKTSPQIKYNESQGWFVQPLYLVEFVVGSVPCSERFFSGYSGTSTDLKRTDTFELVPKNS